MTPALKSFVSVPGCFLFGLLMFGVGVNGVLRCGASEASDIFVFIAVVGFGLLGNSLRLLHRLYNPKNSASPLQPADGNEAGTDLTTKNLYS
ncbi:hypothetical protein V0M98_37775 (plasmid) [Pseudomonas silesiensis]|uniref:hypothetical protein n=1 Tax=Pseudomonas silesiensis TaxID=1853130 RepID=UPI0030CF0568